jgi:Ca2+-binding RTX toxin-like protein
MNAPARRVISTAAVAALALGGLAAVQARGVPKCFGRRATLVGSGKSETLRGTRGPDVIVAKGGNDDIRGLGGDDRLCGGRGADFLIGGGGDDRMSAGAGSTEALWGGPGNDVMDGGAGDSEDVRYVSASGPVTVNLAEGAATGQGSDTIARVDQVIGSHHDDVIYLDDDPAAFEVALGLSGNDTIYGLAGDDAISGADGNDTIVGGDGFDFLNNIYGHEEFGQALTAVNVDLVAGTVTGQGSDSISEVEGSTGTPGDDTFLGNDEANEFTQTFEGNDTVDAGGGDDLVDVGDGNDTADGGPGRDVIGHLDHSNGVTVDLGEQAAAGTGGSDVVRNFEDVIGSFFDDTLTGDNQANFIEGDEGADTMFGLQGDDTLIGDILAFSFPVADGDTAHGAQGTDVCDAETETECETDPPAARRSTSYSTVRYSRQAQW